MTILRKTSVVYSLTDGEKYSTSGAWLDFHSPERQAGEPSAVTVLLTVILLSYLLPTLESLRMEPLAKSSVKAKSTLPPPVEQLSAPTVP
jgi:hypothetical protein